MKISLRSLWRRKRSLRLFNEVFDEFSWDSTVPWVPFIRQEFLEYCNQVSSREAKAWLRRQLDAQMYFDDKNSTVTSGFAAGRPDMLEVAEVFLPDLRERATRIEITRSATTIFDEADDTLVHFAACSRELAYGTGQHPAANASKLIHNLARLDIPPDVVGVLVSDLANCRPMIFIRDQHDWKLSALTP